MQWLVGGIQPSGCCHFSSGSSGAAGDRPSMNFMFIFPSIFVRRSADTCLVSMPTGFSDHNTFSSWTLPSLTWVWTHKSSTSRCRIRPKPRRLAIPIAAHASLCTLTFISKPKSRATDCIPKAVGTPLDMPCSSDSPLDRLIVGWVTLLCFT